MKRRQFTALAGLALAAPLVAPLVAGSSAAHTLVVLPTRPTAAEIMLRVQAVYDKATTFKAAFRQRYWESPSDPGVVSFQKPGKMSWRYARNGNRVVSDGTQVRIYQKATKQLFVQPRHRATQHAVALSFLLDPRELEQRFKLTKLDPRQLKAIGHVLEAVPLEPDAPCARALFYVDAQTYRVRRVLIIDAQGNRNRFDFSTREPSASPSQGEFAFEPPADTQIIYLS